MSEQDLYASLERMVEAARQANREEVIKENNTFSSKLRAEYRHLPNWSTNETVMLYDGVRNRAVDSITNWTNRGKILEQMNERFAALQKSRDKIQ